MRACRVICTRTRAVYANDIRELDKIVDAHWTPGQTKPLVIGPDCNPITGQWVNQFLRNASDVLKVYTYHNCKYTAAPPPPPRLLLLSLLLHTFGNVPTDLSSVIPIHWIGYLSSSPPYTQTSFAVYRNSRCAGHVTDVGYIVVFWI